MYTYYNNKNDCYRCISSLCKELVIYVNSSHPFSAFLNDPMSKEKIQELFCGYQIYYIIGNGKDLSRFLKKKDPQKTKIILLTNSIDALDVSRYIPSPFSTYLTYATVSYLSNLYYSGKTNLTLKKLNTQYQLETLTYINPNMKIYLLNTDSLYNSDLIGQCFTKYPFLVTIANSIQQWIQNIEDAFPNFVPTTPTTPSTTPTTPTTPTSTPTTPTTPTSTPTTPTTTIDATNYVFSTGFFNTPDAITVMENYGPFIILTEGGIENLYK